MEKKQTVWNRTMIVKALSSGKEQVLSSIKNLSKFETMLWLVSVIVVLASFLLTREYEMLVLIASLIGVTALIFLAKGDVCGQILSIIFCILYAVISYQFRYYGEMITYLGMSLPIAVLSTISWIRHPYSENEVQVSCLKKRAVMTLLLMTCVVTFLFYFILKKFGTSNLSVSTVSIATSFLASSLMTLRSPFYALAYVANDLVLIVLWTLAAMQDLSYMPMILCFTMFLVNDVYGFINWFRMLKKQKKEQ